MRSGGNGVVRVVSVDIPDCERRVRRWELVQSLFGHSMNNG